MTAELTKGITREEYDAIPALSYSGMKDLAVSPLRYWDRWLNPDREPEEPSPAMQVGSAFHCAVLEPSEFDKRYYCKIDPTQIDGLLVTMDDLRQFCKDNKQDIPGAMNKRKEDLVAFVAGRFPRVPILDVIEAANEIANAGKVRFDAVDWQRIAWMAKTLLDEPGVIEILDKEGIAESYISWTDKDTGIRLKALLDWHGIDDTLDLKTFSQKVGKSIDKSIADAILYEKYYLQAFVYSSGRGWPAWNGRHVLAFIESEAPHETRIRSLVPKIGGNANLYWERARIEMRSLIRTYAEYMEHFGVNKPWRYAQETTVLADIEMPAMAY